MARVIRTSTPPPISLNKVYINMTFPVFHEHRVEIIYQERIVSLENKTITPRVTRMTDHLYERQQIKYNTMKESKITARTTCCVR